MRTTGIARVTRSVAGCAAAALVLTACGADHTKSAPNITLTIADYGDFGYAKLIRTYQREHPNITIKEKVTDLDPHHAQLAKELAAGRGAADIEAVEESYLPQFRHDRKYFANLADYGADDLQTRWLPWKWQQGVTDNGRFVLGYGTDVGSEAMCYNTDLFRKAGLPTDRDAVSALWPTWDKYLAVGERFAQQGTGAAWYDSDENLFNAILNQTEFSFFDLDDEFIGDGNPKVKDAFMSASENATTLSAKLTAFTPQWTKGIRNAAMATIPCPSWMNGRIEDAAGKQNSGKWDIAKLPGGGGNWGGSFLTVPKQGKHLKEAAALAAWLTAPAQEKQTFAAAGTLPSEPAALSDPEITGYKRRFFNNAPVGRIYAESATLLRPSYRGTRDGDVRAVFLAALVRVQKGQQTEQQAFDQAIRDSKRMLKKK